MARDGLLLRALLLLTTLRSVDPKSLPDYWTRRRLVLQAEDSTNLGGRLSFESGERILNEILMAEKSREIQRGYRDPGSFPPARNFFQAKRDIEESEVFRIIRKMPKGAVLHAHDTALVSDKFVFENVTRRENLWACESEDGRLSLRFMEGPDGDCEWKLLSDLRLDPERARRVDERIRRGMSMRNEGSPSGGYENGNAAWKKFNEIFAFLTPFLTHRPVYEDYYYQALRELYEDNVIYLELRSTLPELYDLGGKRYGPLEVARIYRDATERFARENEGFVGARLVYAPLRTGDPRLLDEYLAVASRLQRELPDFFAGFDLVGQEDGSTPLVHWVDKIRANDRSMNFFFHAGESNWNGLDVDENLLDAVLLGSKRIGHGYALTKHPRILEMARRRRIAIEVCPISNQVLALVGDLRNHPASRLFVEGIPVVVSNDDPGLWGARALSYDFYEAFVGIMSARADLRSLKQLAVNSLYYGSLNDTERNRALSVWQERWRRFVDEYSRAEGTDDRPGALLVLH